jgi:phage head maturation protease
MRYEVTATIEWFTRSQMRTDDAMSGVPYFMVLVPGCFRRVKEQTIPLHINHQEACVGTCRLRDVHGGVGMTTVLDDRSQVQRGVVRDCLAGRITGVSFLVEGARWTTTRGSDGVSLMRVADAVRVLEFSLIRYPKTPCFVSPISCKEVITYGYSYS